MLSMLLALWASRTSLFNELVVGNDADYQRAYEAAQALLQDAELDIRGEKADGTVCTGQDNVCRTSTDRKSTRLNSSHLVISYAVFCLKKKKNKTNTS